MVSFKVASITIVVGVLAIIGGFVWFIKSSSPVAQVESMSFNTVTAPKVETSPTPDTNQNATSLNETIPEPNTEKKNTLSIATTPVKSDVPLQNNKNSPTPLPKESAIPIVPSYTLSDFIAGHNQRTADRFNLVLVPVNFSSLDEFTSVATEMMDWQGGAVRNGVAFGPFAIEPFRSNKNKFNVWYDADVITARTIDEITTRIEERKQKLANQTGLRYVVPIFFNKLRTDSNTFIVNHADGMGIYYSAAYSFNTLQKSQLHPTAVTVTLQGQPIEPNSLAHELGHAIFGLADEKTDGGFDKEGVTPRTQPPDCVASKTEADAIWGNMVGQVDPFYYEWKQMLIHSGGWDFWFAPDTSWWKDMDNGMKVGYYYGKCYGPTEGTRVIRPTEFSIMNTSQIAVFGSVNRKHMEAILGFFSGK